MLKIPLLFVFGSLVVFALTIKQDEPKSFRKILSTLSYSTSDGIPHQVLKIKTEKGINIEIYNTSSNFPSLTSKFEVIGEKDGYFVLGGSGTNLALFDIDHDLKQEILIPTFDKNLTAKLDIIKYDENSKRFIIFQDTVYTTY